MYMHTEFRGLLLPDYEEALRNCQVQGADEARMQSGMRTSVSWFNSKPPRQKFS